MDCLYWTKNSFVITVTPMKKPKAKVQRETKDAVVQLRLTNEQKAKLAEKAKRRGLSLSSWLLMLGISAPDKP